MAKIDIAINEIIKYIDNFSTQDKGITFIFGSGINFNLATNASDWNELGLKSLSHFLRNTYKKYTNFEAKNLAHKLNLILNNNKLAMSFFKKVKIEINLLSNKKNAWFIHTYKRIINNLEGRIDTITLNYDTTISKLMNMTPINSLEREKIISSNKVVNHIHGMVDKNNVISGKSIFTLNSYVDNAALAQKIFINYLKALKDRIQTFIIIGSSMQEEHILKTFKKIKSNPKLRKLNFILIRHLPKYQLFYNELKKIYKELNITLLDIGESENYKEDFMKFWKKLGEAIITAPSRPSLIEIDASRINIPKLYHSIKNENQGRKITIKKIVSQYKIEKQDENPQNLIKIFYWLTKDDILPLEEFKNFFTKNYKKLEINSLWLIQDHYDWLKIEEILDWFNDNIKLTHSIGNNSEEYTIFEYLEINIPNNIFDSSFYLKIEKRKNIMKLIFERILDDYYKLDDKISEYITKHSNITKMNSGELPFIYRIQYPKTSDNIYKLFFNDENYEKYKKIKDLNQFENVIKKYDREWIYYILLLNEENLTKNYKNILEKIHSIKNNFLRIIIHNLIYLMFAQSKTEKEFNNYVNFIRTLKNYPYNLFPRDIDILGRGGSNTPLMSPLDGKIIDNNIEPIREKNQLIELLKSDKWNEKYSEVDILKYIELNFTYELFEEIFNLKIWERFLTSVQFDIKIDDILIYKKIQTKLSQKSSSYFHIGHYLNFIPPYNIYNRVIEIAKDKKPKLDKKELEELEELVKIKAIMSAYKNKDYIYSNIELKKLIENDSKIPFEILNKLFKEQKYIYDILKNCFDYEHKFKTLNEYLLYFYFNPNRTKINPDLIMHFQTNMKVKNRYYINSLFWNIQKIEDKQKQNKCFIKFINHYKDLNNLKGEIENAKKWIVLNNILYKTKTSIKNLDISIFEIFFVIKELTDEEITKNDKLIFSQLNSANNYVSSDNIISYLRMFNYKKLGEKSRKTIGQTIIYWLESHEQNHNVFMYDELIEISKDFQIIEKVKSLIKKKNLTKM